MTFAELQEKVEDLEQRVAELESMVVRCNGARIHINDDLIVNAWTTLNGGYVSGLSIAETQV